MMPKNTTNVFLIFFLSSTIVNGQEKLTVKKITKSDLEAAAYSLAQKGYAGQSEFLNMVKEAGPSSVPVLKQNLHQPNPDVKRSTLTALWTVKTPCRQAASDVTPLLNDPDKWVRYNAVFYLGTQGCSEKKNAILDRMAVETDEDVKRNMVDSLGRLGSKDDVPTLMAIQNSETMPARTRLSAARSLLMLNTPCDMDFVKDGLKSTDLNILSSALDACEYSSEPSLIPIIQTLSTHSGSIDFRLTNIINTIEINKYDKATRIKMLFDFIQSDDAKRRWAVDQLIYRWPQTDIISRLRKIAFNAQNPASSVVMEELDLAGFISREEMKEQMRKLYSTTPGTEK